MSFLAETAVNLTEACSRRRCQRTREQRKEITMENDKMEAIELNDEQIEKAAGGTNTRMKCGECGYSAIWAGDYLAKVVQCPNCGKNTFNGTDHFGGGGFIPLV